MSTVLNYSSPLAYSKLFQHGALDRQAHWPLRFGLASIFSLEGTDKLPGIVAALGDGTLPQDSGTLIAAAQLITAALIVTGGWRGWRGVFGNFLTRAGAALGIPTLITSLPGETWTNLAATADNPSQLAAQPTFLIFCLLAYFLMARTGEQSTA